MRIDHQAATAAPRIRPEPCGDLRRTDSPARELAGRYAAHGGVARGDEVAGLLRACMEQPVSALARWIVCGDLVRIQDGEQWLLPLFQFDFRRGRLLDAVTLAVRELRDPLEPDAIARWFVEPHPLLRGTPPARLAAVDAAAVVDAARFERWWARG